MNAKTAKRIRKYAQIRGIEYSKLKRVYQVATPKEREQYEEDMRNAFEEPVRPAKYRNVVPITPS